MSVKTKLRVLRNLLSDYRRYGKYYADGSASAGNGGREARSILINSHVVEKGLSHRDPKPLFGWQRVSSIAEDLDRYVKKGGRDPFVLGLGTAAVEKYNRFNRDLGCGEDKMIRLTDPVLETERRPVAVGAEETGLDAFFADSRSAFSALCAHRHSLRPYDEKSLPVSRERIVRCVRAAMAGPSACNRQSVRVHAVTDRDKFAEIEDIQGGARGFCQNCGAILVITADVSLYASGEHHLPLIDSGIFVMNLAYALYEEGLGACILNLEMDARQEKRLRACVAAPDREMFAAAVAVSDLEKGPVRAPVSAKRDVDDILRFV